MTTLHDPTRVLREALARRGAGAVHPWPDLIAQPSRFCTACGVHRASEAGAGKQPTLCPSCQDGDTA